MALILQLLTSLFTAAGQLMEWLAGERLRKLGRLEVENADQQEALRAASRAQSIDAAPDVRDPDELLKRLSGKPD